jgi:ATP-dependent DNA helicase RecQ
MERALLLDLEVSFQGDILKIGAVRGSCTFTRSRGGSREGMLKDLARFAEGAECLAGHNLVRHDLPMLREIAPGHAVHSLPVLDTLVLSPICFPENPYHRLVKDYKLVRESLNDPVADTRQAAALFADEFNALCGMRRTEPELLELLDFLLATPDQPGEPPPRTVSLTVVIVTRCRSGRYPSLKSCLKIVE